MLSATPLQFHVVDDAAVNRLYRYDAVGAALGNTTLATANAAPRGAASTVAVEQTWVIDANRNVYVYNMTGGLLGSWSVGSIATNATPEGIATDGNDIWIVDSRSDKVFRYAGAASRISGSQPATSSFSLNSSNSNPKDIVCDGASLWIVDDAKKTDKVFKYTIDGAYVGSWAIDSANKAPTGLAIDPANVGDIWIADSGTDRVYKYTAAAGRNSGSQSATSNFALASGNSNAQGLVVPGRPWAETPYEVSWVRQFGSAGDEIGLGVAADGSGNSYLSGRTNSSLAAPNTSGLDVPVLAQYDTSGNSTWVQQQNSIPGVGYSGVRVEADSLGNVFQVVSPGNGGAATLNNYDTAGTLQWTIALPGGEEIYGVTADGLGYAYVSSYAGNLVYVRKFDGPTGNIFWEQVLDTGGFTRSSGLSADHLGNIYVSGYTHGSVFGPNAGGADGFLAKYSDAGVFLWAKQFGSTGIDYVWDVAADGAGNAYTVGQTNGALGGPNAGGQFDVFVTKHDAAGTQQWIRQIGTSSDETFNGVWADDAGNVYAAGWTRGALGGASLGGNADALLVKYSTAGDLVWSKQLGTIDRDATNDVFGDDLGNIYLAGNTRGSWTAPNAGGTDFVLIKLLPPSVVANSSALDPLGATAAVVTITPNAVVEASAVTTLASRPPRGRFNPGRSAALATDDASTLNLNLLNVATAAARAAVFDTVHAEPKVETNDIPALDAAFAAFDL
jgi:hypothetical protein